MSYVKQFEGFCCHYVDREEPTRYINQLKHSASASEVITVDLETTGLDPLEDKIALIGIGVRDQSKGWNCYLFDQLDHDFSQDLRPLLEAPEPFKLGHNFKFDWSFLWHRMGIDCQPILDTMLAAIISEYTSMHERNRWSLGALTSRKLGLEMDKEEEVRTSFKGGPYSDRQLHYAASDLVQTGELWNSYASSLNSHFDIVKLECDIIPLVASAELAGMKIDPSRLDSLKKEAQKTKTNLEEQLPWMGSTFNSALKPIPEAERLNPNSPKQIKEFFSEQFGIALKDTSEKTLKQIEADGARALADLILKCKANKKLIGTYLKKLDPDSLREDGRIRGRFFSMGARTGRFSVQGILQTIPRQQEIRELFVPEIGNCYVIADYSQIELRVSAELSGDKTMQDAFVRGQDLHKLTASKAFGVSEEEVTKEQRTAAKAINFGLIYGMSPKGLVSYMKSYGIEITVAEARRFHQAFFDLYKSFRPYHNRLWVRADREFREHEQVILETRSGRKRRLTEDEMRYTSSMDASETWPRKTIVYNTPVQSLASDGLKQALVFLWPKLKALGAYPVNLIHDEIVVECKQNRADEVAEILENAMINGMQCYLKKVPVVVETKIASSWAEK